ncbi:hypothetical protein KI387_013009, partial [Taxus chinensis]
SVIKEYEDQISYMDIEYDNIIKDMDPQIEDMSVILMVKEDECIKFKTEMEYLQVEFDRTSYKLKEFEKFEKITKALNDMLSIEKYVGDRKHLGFIGNNKESYEYENVVPSFHEYQKENMKDDDMNKKNNLKRKIRTNL